MQVYAITDQQVPSDELSLPILECGAKDESAMLLFTERQLAEQYITEAGWKSDQQIAEMTTGEAAKLLVVAAEQAVDFLAINPIYSEPDAETVPLDDLPTEAQTALHRATKTASAS